jgi:hypothetical protein
VQVDEQTFRVGAKVLLPSDAPGGRYSTFFEDDGETAYFYALDLTRSSDLIVDAVHIYNVASVVDRDRPSVVTIVWSADESKCALLINDYPHAVFDFTAKRGYCRTNFPNFPDSPEEGWRTSDHSWSDNAASWLTSGQRTG